MEILKTNIPLWVEKLSDDKLMQYIEALNDFEIKGQTDNQILISSASTWYYSENASQEDEIKSLAHDVYKEAAIRWHDVLV